MMITLCLIVALLTEILSNPATATLLMPIMIAMVWNKRHAFIKEYIIIIIKYLLDRVDNTGVLFINVTKIELTKGKSVLVTI